MPSTDFHRHQRRTVRVPEDEVDQPPNINDDMNLYLALGIPPPPPDSDEDDISDIEPEGIPAPIQQNAETLMNGGLTYHIEDMFRYDHNFSANSLLETEADNQVVPRAPEQLTQVPEASGIHELAIKPEDNPSNMTDDLSLTVPEVDKRLNVIPPSANNLVCESHDSPLEVSELLQESQTIPVRDNNGETRPKQQDMTITENSPGKTLLSTEVTTEATQSCENYSETNVSL